MQINHVFWRVHHQLKLVFYWWFTGDWYLICEAYIPKVLFLLLGLRRKKGLNLYVSILYSEIVFISLYSEITSKYCWIVHSNDVWGFLALTSIDSHLKLKSGSVSFHSKHWLVPLWKTFLLHENICSNFIFSNLLNYDSAQLKISSEGIQAWNATLFIFW